MSVGRIDWDEDTWRDDTPQEGDLLSRRILGRILLVALAALLGLSIGLGVVLAGERGESGVAWAGLGVVGVAALLLLGRYFEAGIVVFCGLCWVGLGTPSIAQGTSGGGAQRLQLSHAGLSALLLVFTLRHFLYRRVALYRTPVNLPLLVYLGLCFWSTGHNLLFPDLAVGAHGPAIFVQVNVLEVGIRVLALGGLLVVANSLHGKWLAAATAALTLPGVLTFSGLFKFLPGGGNSYLAFAQTPAMSVLAALALAGAGPRWLRWTMGAVALAIFGNFFLKGTEWVSGWLGAGIALTVLVYRLRRKLFWAGVAAVLLTVLVRFDYFYEKIYAENFYAGGVMTWGLQGRSTEEVGAFENDRVRMHRAALLYAENFPLGIGLGNFRAYNSYYGRPEVWNTTTFTSAHGTYAQALSETGWPGLLALLWLLAAIVRTLRRGVDRLPDGWRRAVVLAIFAGALGDFVAAFLGDYLFPAYYNGGMASFGACTYIWLFVGLALAILRAHDPESESAAR